MSNLNISYLNIFTFKGCASLNIAIIVVPNNDNWPVALLPNNDY